jgi:serine protease Do
MKRYLQGVGVTLVSLSLATSVGAAGATLPSGSVNPAPIVGLPNPSPASFADVIERVSPAVVSIDVEGKAHRRDVSVSGSDGFGPNSGHGGDSPFGDLRRVFPGPPETAARPLHASGSGFFISADGYIVTNNHVVDGADKITIRTKDDKTYDARLIGRDPDTDLAVLKVEGRAFPFVSFEDRAKPRVGDWVVAIGNPFNLGGTATAGIVSALQRPQVSGSTYVDYMQIDAPINHGNSGGPTFDLYGRVVGVNSAIFSPSGGSVGIGFDIPADVAATVTRQLIATGSVTRGYIGATVQTITPDIADSLGLGAAFGALVADVVADGPSARAGLQSGDLILKVDGVQVRSADDLTRQVALAHPGQDLRLDLRRDGKPRTLTIRSGARPSAAAVAENAAGGGSPEGGLGLMVTPNPGGGVRVQSVTAGSDAAQKGLRPGDVIKRIGTQPANTPGDIRAAAADARAHGRKDVLILVARDRQHLFLPLSVSDPARS